MSFALVVLIGVLFTVGTYLLLHRSLIRIVLGIGILANGVNMVILATSTQQGTPPMVEQNEPPFTDPVPQALVLTAIVIGFALTAYLVAFAWRIWTIDGSDLVQDDVEDRLLNRHQDAIDSASINETQTLDYDAYLDGGDIHDSEDVDVDNRNKGTTI